jgi:hypothetical protein
MAAFKELSEEHLAERHWPYGFYAVRRSKDVYDAKDWCTEQFGQYRRGRWSKKGELFYFRREADAMAFKLRWC